MNQDNTYSKQIESVNTFLRKSKEDYQMYSELLKTKSDEVNDLEHEIEIATYDASRTASRKLRRTLKERRTAKDMVEILQRIMDCMEKHKGFQNDFSEVLGKVRKEEKYHASRRYCPKVRTDMTIKTYSIVK